uniref:Uncharacterized protein n=1 Tax=Parascaris equorum TaxID=6256 RepID=A0A914RXS0_PAREQ
RDSIGEVAGIGDVETGIGDVETGIGDVETGIGDVETGIETQLLFFPIAPSIDEIWGDLEKGLNEIYSRQTMTPTRYMELYRLGHVRVSAEIG